MSKHDPWTYRADAAPQVERAAPSGPVGSTVIGGPLYTDAFGARRAPTPFQLVESYKSLLYACVQINANAVSQVPLRLYADSSRGDEPRSLSGPRSITRAVHSRLRGLGYVRSVGSVRDVKEITAHPFLDCLDEPDPGGYFDRQSLLDLIVRYCDVIGTAYVMLDGPKRGVPNWLWPLASQYVTVIPAPSTPLIEGYRYFDDVFPYDQVLRFRCTTSLRDPYKAAFSPSYAATDYAGLEDAWVAIQTNLLGNGPRLAMIASAKDPAMAPGDVERRRFAQDLEANYSRGNAGKVLVTNGAYDFTPWNQTPADLAGLEVSRYDLERTANVFGIPLPFLSGETNLANLQAAREQHAKNAVEPRCKHIAAVLTRFARRFDPRLFFAFDSAVPEDEERRAKIAQMRLTTGQTTINEENEEMQWEPKPWGDEPWLSGSLKQPTMLTEAHEQGQEQAKAGMEMMKADAAAAAAGEEEEEGGEEIEDESERSVARDTGYNPYRAPDGSFAPGPRKKRKKKRFGKRKSRRKITQQQVHDHIVGSARGAGLKARYSSGPAKNRTEWNDAAHAHDNGSHLFEVKVHHKPTVEKNGSTTEFRSVLNDGELRHGPIATVRPDPGGKGRWEVQDHVAGSSHGFKTEEKALAYARKGFDRHNREAAASLSERVVSSAPASDRWFYRDGGKARSDVMKDTNVNLPAPGHEGHFEYDVRHIRPTETPPPPSSKARSVEPEYAPVERSSHRKPRVPEAMSAESILRLVLRRRGWVAAYRADALTPEQRIELLADIRDYARARLRVEAQAFAREHLGYEERAIGDAVAGQFRRFFGRVRGFVREAIVAGALAFSGPGGLDADDLNAAEAAARVQDGYLAKFEAEMLASPPVPLDPTKTTTQQVGPDGTAVEILITPPGTTPGEFVARAESYGSSVYASAQNVARAKVGRKGAFDQERRVHLGHDVACPICEEATARGWQPIGTLPEIGDSYCMNNCHCFFEYRKKPEPST